VRLVNSEVGTIEPIKEIAKTLRKLDRKPLLHVDAAQAPLWLPLNVERLGVDLMTLDAQKILGPKGVGCLYVRRGTELEPILWGGGQEQGVRAGTENVPLAGSFAVALAEAQKNVERTAAHTARMRDYLWALITKSIPNAILNGPALGSTRVANNINVSVPGLEAQMAVIAMDALGVAVSTRSACSVGEDEPSHVIAALGGPPELGGTAVRITLLPSATRADVRRIARAFVEAEKRYNTR
jgi:cysteine desulfurase